MIEMAHSNSDIMESVIDNLNLTPENSLSESLTLSVDEDNDADDVESKLSQFLRDINLSNTGSMVFNLNYISKL